MAATSIRHDGGAIPFSRDKSHDGPLKKRRDPIPDDEPDFFQKEDELNSSPEVEHLADLGLILDLADDPEKEKELSRYQKLRLCKIFDELSKKHNLVGKIPRTLGQLECAADFAAAISCAPPAACCITYSSVASTTLTCWRCIGIRGSKGQ